MHLDLPTLFCASTAAVAFATAVLSVFFATQTTHRGFRAWLAAQWLLVAGLTLHALGADNALIGAVAAVLVAQWPIAVLAGLRRLHPRKPPWLPEAVDWIFLALASVVIVGAGLSELGALRSVSAFALAEFGITLYAAVLTTRLSGFKRSFGLKALVALNGVAAIVEAACLAAATGHLSTPHSVAALQAATQLMTALLGLGLAPLALSLTYERSVTKMRATHRKLRHLADMDMLTRLPNRRHFHELASAALANTALTTTAVLLFDIENLKRINDLLGPASGDEALRQVGLAVRETLRSQDIAGRVGGDEFAALLPDTTVADAVRVADRLTEHLEDRQVAPRTARLTLNVGAVQMRAGDTIVDALRRADLALDDARSHRHDRPTAAARAESRVAFHAVPGLDVRTV